MKKRKYYIIIALLILIIIIAAITIIIVVKNKNNQNNSTENEVFVAQEPTGGDGGEATDEKIEKNFKLERKDIPEEVDAKIQDTEKFYKDLEKEGKVQQRIIATINKQDNTYTFEYYM